MGLFDFLRANEYKAQVRRLEAFLGALPGSYMGWTADGLTLHNPDLPVFLEAGDTTLTWQNMHTLFADGSRAAVESALFTLSDARQPFDLTARLANNPRTLHLSGRAGADLSGQERFFLVYFYDASDLHASIDQLKEQQDQQSTVLRDAADLLTGIPRPAWQRNQMGEIVWCNNAYAAALNTDIDEAVSNRRELPFTLPGKKTGAADPLALYRQVRETGEARHDMRHLIARGVRRYMQVHEFPISRKGHTGGIALDMTREEELETMRRRDQSATKELLSQLTTAIAIFDVDQKIEFYNSAFAQLWQLDDGWLNTHPKLGDILEKLRETRHLPEQADFRKYKQLWLDRFTKLIGQHDDLLHLPDGRTLRMVTIPHPMGGLMMTFEDVTSHLELESSYNTLIAVQRETLDNLSEGVAVFGSDGRLKLFNPSFAALWRFNPEDVEGEPHITRLLERMKSRFAADHWDSARVSLMNQVLSHEDMQGRLTQQGGVLIDFATVTLPDGGVLVTHMDVTDTVRVETALRERNAALETAEQLKGDFLANVSYQLRTPLNTVMGFSEIIANEYFGPLNARQKEYAQGISEAGERLVHLIDDILDLTTIEAGYMQLDAAEMNIAALLQSVFDIATDWTRKEDTHLKLALPETLPVVHGDERRIKQVLINLIRNAISFTPDGGTITLSAQAQENGVSMTVADTGFGIPLDDQRRIFEPFERAKTVKRRDGRIVRGGAGLGLSLVKMIAELHGGSVSLQSEPGKGTAITVFIPFHPPAASAG